MTHPSSSISTTRSMSWSTRSRKSLGCVQASMMMKTGIYGLSMDQPCRPCWVRCKPIREQIIFPGSILLQGKIYWQKAWQQWRSISPKTTPFTLKLGCCQQISRLSKNSSTTGKPKRLSSSRKPAARGKESSWPEISTGSNLVSIMWRSVTYTSLSSWTISNLTCASMFLSHQWCL